MKLRQQADVIDMQLWRSERASRPPMPQQPAADGGYACTLCGSELFRILESGRVRCGGCSAYIRNLEALRPKGT